MDEVVPDRYLIALSLVLAVVGGWLLRWVSVLPGTVEETDMAKKRVKGATGGGSLPDETPAPELPTKLLQATDFTFVGSFRVPPGSKGVPAQSASFGGTALCYWPAHGTLMMCGHDHHQWITEFDIPTPIIASTVAELPRANEVQPYTD